MENIDIDIDIYKKILENIDIDIDNEIFENIDIDINKEIFENIDIDKISNRLEFGISNRAGFFTELNNSEKNWLFFSHFLGFIITPGWPLYTISNVETNCHGTPPPLFFVDAKI